MMELSRQNITKALSIGIMLMGVVHIVTLAILNIDGILAVCYMQGNPFAWIIFALTMGLLFANVTKRRI